MLPLPLHWTWDLASAPAPGMGPGSITLTSSNLEPPLVYQGPPYGVYSSLTSADTTSTRGPSQASKQASKHPFVTVTTIATPSIQSILVQLLTQRRRSTSY